MMPKSRNLPYKKRWEGRTAITDIMVQSLSLLLSSYCTPLILPSQHANIKLNTFFSNLLPFYFSICGRKALHTNHRTAIT